MGTKNLQEKVRKLEAERKRRNRRPLRVVVVGEGCEFEDYDAWKRQADPDGRYCIVRLSEEDTEF